MKSFSLSHKCTSHRRHTQSHLNLKRFDIYNYRLGDRWNVTNSTVAQYSCRLNNAK